MPPSLSPWLFLSIIPASCNLMMLETSTKDKLPNLPQIRVLTPFGVAVIYNKWLSQKQNPGTNVKVTPWSLHTVHYMMIVCRYSIRPIVSIKKNQVRIDVCCKSVSYEIRRASDTKRELEDRWSTHIWSVCKQSPHHIVGFQDLSPSTFPRGKTTPTLYIGVHNRDKTHCRWPHLGLALVQQ